MQTAMIKNNELLNNYAPSPTLPFDVEGKLVEKKGKEVKIEKKIDSKTFQYSLKLKEELKEKVGEDVKIDKSNIASYRVEEKKEDKVENINIEKTLRELGLKYTSENIRMIENLLQNGIRISKANVDSYIESKKYLKKIIENIDIEKAIKLQDLGIDLEDDSLQRISEALEGIGDDKFSFKRLFKFNKDMDYKEAEKITKEIYGQKMGKDVYDSIIALSREKIPITKENIEKTLDGVKKINDLKNLEDKVYVRFIDKKKEFNIDNLYKEKNGYSNSGVESSKEAILFENMSVKSQASLETLKEVLLDIGVEDSIDNVIILREFISNDMDITKEKYNKLIDMKNAVGELLNIVEEDGIESMAVDRSNLKEDIFLLIDRLKNKEETNIDSKIIDDEFSLDKKDYKTLNSIEDKDLLALIKDGKDFNIKNILEIKETNLEDLNHTLEYKTVETTKKLVDIFKSLGDNLSSKIISKANNIDKTISLESLYIANSENGLSKDQNKRNINREKIEFIKGEYIKIKTLLTTNTIKSSIIEGKSVAKMPIAQLSPYIQKSLNRYREIEKSVRDIRNIKTQDRLIPLIMKNDLDMTLKEFKDLDKFLNKDKNIVNEIKDLLEKDNSEEIKQTVKMFQKNISDEIKKGNWIEEDYKELINTISGENTSSGEKREKKKNDEYIQIKDKISKKDLIFQLPIEIGDRYRTLNVIVPGTDKGIDKNNMNFFVSIETENIGKVDININVRGRDIYMDLDEEKGLLTPVIDSLKNQLKSIGYALNLSENQVIM